VGPVAKEVPPLSFRLDGLGFFPNARAPRVVWLGLKGDTESLTRLQQRLEGEFAKAGFAIEDRPFRPHATMGRTKRRREKVDNFAADLPSFGRTDSKSIDRLILFQSQLSSSGPQYDALKNFLLTGKPRT